MAIALHDKLEGEAASSVRFVRVTPMKARRVLNVIRRKNAAEAMTSLKFMPQAASHEVLKVLNSAVNNAKFVAEQAGKNLDDADFTITRAYADEAPTMKRFRARARGQGARINKRTSHITIAVAPSENINKSGGDHGSES